MYRSPARYLHITLLANTTVVPPTQRSPHTVPPRQVNTTKLASLSQREGRRESAQRSAPGPRRQNALCPATYNVLFAPAKTMPHDTTASYLIRKHHSNSTACFVSRRRKFNDTMPHRAGNSLRGSTHAARALTKCSAESHNTKQAKPPQTSLHAPLAVILPNIPRDSKASGDLEPFSYHKTHPH